MCIIGTTTVIYLTTTKSGKVKVYLSSCLLSVADIRFSPGSNMAFTILLWIIELHIAEYQHCNDLRCGFLFSKTSWNVYSITVLSAKTTTSVNEFEISASEFVGKLLYDEFDVFLFNCLQFANRCMSIVSFCLELAFKLNLEVTTLHRLQ